MKLGSLPKPLHGLVAGLLALAVYLAVFTVVSANPTTWSFFTACTDPISILFCFFAGSLAILTSLILIGLPIALIISGTYLKLAKFSLGAAILIPVLSNMTVAVIIVGLSQFTDINLPLWTMALLVPVTYLVLTNIAKKP